MTKKEIRVFAESFFSYPDKNDFYSYDSVDIVDAQRDAFERGFIECIRIHTENRNSPIIIEAFNKGYETCENKNKWIPICEVLPPNCTNVETKYKNTRQYYFHLENGNFENCNYNPTHWRNIL